MIYFEWFNINLGAPPLGFRRVTQTPGLIGLNKDFIFWQSGFLFSSTNNLISMSRSISLINPHQSFHGLICQIIKQHASAVLVLESTLSKARYKPKYNIMVELWTHNLKGYHCCHHNFFKFYNWVQIESGRVCLKMIELTHYSNMFK